jgi:hypothetical protein
MLEVKQLETNDTINIVNNAWSQTIRNQWYNKVWLQALFTMFIVSLVSNCLTSSIIYNVYCIIRQSETNDTINIVNNAWSQTIRNQWYNKHCK